MTDTEDRIADMLAKTPHSLHSARIADAMRPADTLVVWQALDRLEAAGRVVQHARGWYRRANNG